MRRAVEIVAGVLLFGAVWFVLFCMVFGVLR